MKKSSSVPQHCSLRIPATTANLGPGFDSLGVALKLYNQVTTSLVPTAPAPTGMIAATAKAFFAAAGLAPVPFSATVTGDVPISRGLGSSVTVRLGVMAGLNALTGRPLSPEQILELVIVAEGHPDNAVPAFYGGFAACGKNRFVRTEVAPALKFIALIPEFTLETKKARAVLPRQVPLVHAVANLQQVSLITAAFLQRNYAMLEGLFQDKLHQPYRAKLIPCWQAVEQAAFEAGALGFYLSGAGSTLMALTTHDADDIAEAMVKAAAAAEVACNVKILTADNEGLKA